MWKQTSSKALFTGTFATAERRDPSWKTPFRQIRINRKLADSFLPSSITTIHCKIAFSLKFLIIWGDSIIMFIVPTDKLKPGIILAEEVRDINGRLLLAKGNEIGDNHIRIF